MTFINVLLPAPFSPSRAWISPGSTTRSMWSLATRDPNTLVMPRSSSFIAPRLRQLLGPDTVAAQPGPAGPLRRSGGLSRFRSVHQRALAGAVLPQQSVDLTGLDHQVDVVVGHQGSEHLGDATQFELHRSSASSVAWSGHRSGPARTGWAATSEWRLIALPVSAS